MLVARWTQAHKHALMIGQFKMGYKILTRYKFVPLSAHCITFSAEHCVFVVVT